MPVHRHRGRVTASPAAHSGNQPQSKPPSLSVVPPTFGPDNALTTLRFLAEAVAANPRSVKLANKLTTLTQQMDAHLSAGGELPSGWKTSARARRKMAAARQAHARAGDPSTSHAAAASVTASGLRDRQLAVQTLLAQRGPMHFDALITAYQTAHTANPKLYPRQAPSGIRTRVSELVALGIAHDTGQKVLLPSNRQAILWAV